MIAYVNVLPSFMKLWVPNQFDYTVIVYLDDYHFVTLTTTIT